MDVIADPVPAEVAIQMGAAVAQTEKEIILRVLQIVVVVGRQQCM